MTAPAARNGQLWGSLELNNSQTLILHRNGEDGKEEIALGNVIAVLDSESEVEGQRVREYELLYLGEEALGEVDKSSEKNHIMVSRKHIRSLPERILREYLILGFPKHLHVARDAQGNCNLHIIVSVRSGTCMAATFFSQIVEKVLQSFGLTKGDYDVHITTSDRSVKEFVSETLAIRANEGSAQTVLLLSGDGGMVDIVNGLLQSSHSPQFVKPIVGLLAMGTGNALANSTGLNNGPTRGIRSFLRGNPHNLPIFTVRFSAGTEYLLNEGQESEPLGTEGSEYGVVHGAVVCSWALHASLVADSDTTEYRKYGAQRFQMAAQELLHPSDGSSPHVYQGRITLFKKTDDGQEYSTQLDRTQHLYVLATLVSNLEERLKISPYSKPLDGQLRLVHFGNTSSEEVMRILGLAFADGRHVEEEGVGYDNIEGMRIDFEEADSRWRRVCVDGKIIRVAERGWLEVRRESREVVDLIADIS